VTWVDAALRLPAPQNLPVEVILANGKTEIRQQISGDWRPVVRWRTISKHSIK
jgi:hypothetical protein